jgi:hypothetical protein
LRVTNRNLVNPKRTGSVLDIGAKSAKPMAQTT